MIGKRNVVFVIFFSLTLMGPIIMKTNPRRENCVQWNMNRNCALSLFYVFKSNKRAKFN